MDPISDKYILDVDIPRSHELKYKKVLRSHTAPFFLSVPRSYGWRSQTGADRLGQVRPMHHCLLDIDSSKCTPIKENI